MASINAPAAGQRILHTELLGRSPDDNSRVVAQIETSKRKGHLRLLIVKGSTLAQTMCVTSIEQGLVFAKAYHADSTQYSSSLAAVG